MINDSKGKSFLARCHRVPENDAFMGIDPNGPVLAAG